MSAVTQVKITPLQRIKDLIQTKQWEDCKQELKYIYRLIKPRYTEDKQNDLLLYIYNEMRYQCPDGLITFLHYMNN